LLHFGVIPYSWQNVVMLCPEWRKLKAACFIDAGVAFLAMPNDDRPSHPF
jgi:hypothetical protein